MKWNKIRNWIIFNYITGILIVLLGIDIGFHISSSILDSQQIVLIFVGILATFIVVSNHLQVIVAKDEFNQQVKSLGENFDEEIEYQKSLINDVAFDIYKNQSFNFSENGKIEWAIASYCRAMIYALNNEDKEKLLNCIGYLENIENYKELLENEMIGEWINDIQNHKNYDIIRTEFEDLIK